MSEDGRGAWLLYWEGDNLYILHPELGPCLLRGPFGSVLGPRIDFSRAVVSDADKTVVLTGESVADATDDLIALGWSKKKIRKLGLRQQNIAILSRR